MIQQNNPSLSLWTILCDTGLTKNKHNIVLKGFKLNSSTDWGLRWIYFDKHTYFQI